MRLGRLGVVGVILAGCGGEGPPVPPVPPEVVAVLEVLVQGDSTPVPATGGEIGRVRVTRDSQAVTTEQGMALGSGDRVETNAGGIGVARLEAGYEVILDPNTDITIERGSIFVRIGRVIVRKVADVVEALTVNTAIAAAAVEGTAFVVEVEGDSTNVIVLEGAVRVTNRGDTRWRRAVRYTAGEGGTMTRLAIRAIARPATAVRATRLRVESINRVRAVAVRRGGAGIRR